MKNVISFCMVIALLVFDLLEPIFRSKELYFSLKVDWRGDKLKGIYKNYLRKVIMITLPIGIFLWYYYPIEKDVVGFFFGFLVMVSLNLFFYFDARRKIKNK